MYYFLQMVKVLCFSSTLISAYFKIFTWSYVRGNQTIYYSLAIDLDVQVRSSESWHGFYPYDQVRSS